MEKEGGSIATPTFIPRKYLHCMRVVLGQAMNCTPHMRYILNSDFDIGNLVL